MFGVPEFSCEACIQPPNPAVKPHIKKTNILIKFTGTPDSLAASSFPPTAYIYLPILVLDRKK